jgi:hypothetical protein
MGVRLRCAAAAPAAQPSRPISKRKSAGRVGAAGALLRGKPGAGAPVMMQALSVKQPAASLIVNGDTLLPPPHPGRKDIENRSRILFDEKKWRMPFCVLVHAPKARMKGGVGRGGASVQAKIRGIRAWCCWCCVI